MGMQAVAHVILNRFKSGKWFSAQTVAGVCGKKQQFSIWDDDCKARQALFDCPMDDPLLEKARAIVASIEVSDDPTGGATFYYSTTMVNPPPWAETGTFTVQIGKHRFYRDVP